MASAGLDQTVRLWDVAGAREVLALGGPTDRVLGIALSPDGALLAAIGADHVLRIWDGTPLESRSAATIRPSSGPSARTRCPVGD
ncbi:MAG: hypothetical protein IRY99_19185 [Isosphaeraceae bacterium]|nr:hypothetical protein [Isosphaeraceae bacterium]